MSIADLKAADLALEEQARDERHEPRSRTAALLRQIDRAREEARGFERVRERLEAQRSIVDQIRKLVR